MLFRSTVNVLGSTTATADQMRVTYHGIDYPLDNNSDYVHEAIPGTATIPLRNGEVYSYLFVHIEDSAQQMTNTYVIRIERFNEKTFEKIWVTDTEDPSGDVHTDEFEEMWRDQHTLTGGHMPVNDLGGNEIHLADHDTWEATYGFEPSVSSYGVRVDTLATYIELNATVLATDSITITEIDDTNHPAYYTGHPQEAATVRDQNGSRSSPGSYCHT